MLEEEIHSFDPVRSSIKSQFTIQCIQESLTPLCGFCLFFQEHPGDEAWVKLDHMITPLLLNFCQCKLLEGQYYEVIEHCSSLIFKYEGKAKLLVLSKKQWR